jgi:Activator of Hsp90 ATPase homolog 1-like protein
MASLRVGDNTVKAETGKTWHEWFEILSSGSARNLRHKEMATFLGKRYCLNDYWCQMITNAFEQYAERHGQYQQPEGHEISVSKIFPFEVKILYECWFSVEERDHWLQESGFKVTTLTRNRSIRAQWDDAKSSLSVDFYPTGKDRTQIVVQHSRLDSLEAAEKMQTFWRNRLSRLNELLERRLSP